MAFHLSERQEATVSTAITILAAGVIVAGVAVLIYVLSAFVRAFSAVILPLVVAAVAALVFQPYYEWLQNRLRWPKPLAVAGVFASVIVPLAFFFWFFGALAADQIGQMAEGAPQWWAKTSTQLEARWPQVRHFLDENPYGQQIQAAVGDNSGALVEAVQMFVRRLFNAGLGALGMVVGLLGWLVAPVYFAFFLTAETGGINRLGNYLPFLKPSTRDDVVYLVREFINIVVAFFRGQIIIAFLQGMLFAIGFTLAGLNYGFVLGLALGFLNIIPYLGNIVGLGLALPIAFFQQDGGLGRVLAVMTVFVAVQMIEGYLLTPKIMGDRTGLHPMAIIVAILFWGSALSGIVGMILAIPLTAFLVVFWRLAREKYVRELV